MELISATHPEILTPISKSRYGYAFISFGIRDICFNVNLAKKYNINAEDNIFFVKDKSFLYFYQSKDAGGFKIQSSWNSKPKKPSYPLRIRTAPVVSFLKRTLQMDKNKSYRYYVAMSDNYMNGHQLIEVLIHKEISDVGKSHNNYSFTKKVV